MKALAQLCCLVLMLVGLGFIGSDILGATRGRSLTWVPEPHYCLWQWGMAAIFAGVVGTALLNIAEALGHRAGLPKPSKPETTPQ